MLLCVVIGVDIALFTPTMQRKMRCIFENCSNKDRTFGNKKVMLMMHIVHRSGTLLESFSLQNKNLHSRSNGLWLVLVEVVGSVNCVLASVVAANRSRLFDDILFV